jgi:hypothetical protein
MQQTSVAADCADYTEQVFRICVIRAIRGVVARDACGSGFSLPIEDDGNGRDRFLQGRIHEEPRIRGHHVFPAWRGLPRSPKTGGKQWNGRIRFNGRTVRSKADRNSHEPVIGRDVEQFLTIAASLHKTTALNSTPGCGKTKASLLELDISVER